MYNANIIGISMQNIYNNGRSKRIYRDIPIGIYTYNNVTRINSYALCIKSVHNKVKNAHIPCVCAV